MLTERLRQALQPWVAMGKRVVVHTVGFSADHDYKVRDRVCGCICAVHHACDCNTCSPSRAHLQPLASFVVCTRSIVRRVRFPLWCTHAVVTGVHLPV